MAQANVTLEAVLFQKDLPLRQVLDFAVGDTFMFDLPPDQPIPLKCGDIALARCRMGRLDERIAVSIVDDGHHGDADAGVALA